MENKVTLRNFTTSDVDNMMLFASDPKVSKFCSWETFDSKSDLLTYIENRIIPHPYCKAICLNSKPIGTILVTRTIDACRAEIGYHLASGFWGKGIATEAVKMVLRNVFDEMLGLERVEALVEVGNLGSVRVLEKVGFKREGVLRKYVFMKGLSRDMIMFSFLSTDKIKIESC